jgi:exonuclease VII small subunit
MPFQWDITPLAEQDVTAALDFGDFLTYDSSYPQCLSNDQLSQLFIPEPDLPDMSDMESWEPEPSKQANMQISHPQFTTDQNYEDVRQIVCELVHRLDKWEESMEFSIVKWEQKAIKQEEMLELRLRKAEQMVRDLQCK